MDGGTANFLHYICLELHKRGHDVRVMAPICPNDQGFDSHQPYQICRYRQGRYLSSVIPLLRSLSYIVSEKVDLVFLGHAMGVGGLRAVLGSRCLGVPYVMLVHGTDIAYAHAYLADGMAARWVFDNATLLLANSTFTQNRIRRAGHSERDIAILHPGVDTERFHPEIDVADVVGMYGLQRKKVCLTVARLTERKGHANVLAVLPLVIARVPNVVYLIVGKGPMESLLRQQVVDLGLTDHVRFLGYVDEQMLPQLYNACDVFLMPSSASVDGEDIEGFGIVYLEASACGKPVIGGGSGGVADAVMDGETGLLVDPHAVDELAAAIIRLLTDERYARYLGTKGRQRVVQNFTWDQIGERLETHLKHIREYPRDR